MARPKHGTGKTTDWREDLNSFRRTNTDAFNQKIAEVKQIYADVSSIDATARKLGIGKRTLERAMTDIPELQAAIDSVRVSFGR